MREEKGGGSFAVLGDFLVGVVQVETIGLLGPLKSRLETPRGTIGGDKEDTQR